MPQQPMTVNPVYQEDLEGNTTYVGSEVEGIDSRLSAVEEQAYQADDYSDPVAEEARNFEEAHAEYDHGNVDEDTQTLFDLARQNYDDAQINHLNELLSDADEDLQAAVLQSIFDDMESSGAFQGLEEVEEVEESQPQEIEITDDLGPMSEGETELFTNVVTDLTGYEPLGQEYSDKLTAAAEAYAEYPIFRDMLLASAAFHNGGADFDQIGRALVAEYGKTAVYESYQALMRAAQQY